MADEYTDRGLTIMAFPCNQFAREEPGTHEEILSFVDQFGVRDKLTWFEKANVNGTNTREVYSYLKQELPNQSGALEIEWNFEKFLVTHDGKPYKRYSPQCSPFAMREDIEQLLKEVKK